jgi:membrane protein implicated in regulation of membrane protease activity
MEWFSALDGFSQFFWIIALTGSLIFVFVIITTFMGMDGGDDFDGVDAEVDGDAGIGFQFITFKNLVGFFTIFGWIGIACINSGFSKLVSVIVALGCGLLMMSVMAAMFYGMRKLSDSGTLKYKNAINAIGEVYLTIGANRTKMGKVSVRVQGTLRELEALSDSLSELKSGTIIQVVDVTSNGILIVQQTKKPIEPIKTETYELPSDTTKL